MRKYFLVSVVAFSIFMVLGTQTLAERYAQCDACGLCKDTTRTKWSLNIPPDTSPTPAAYRYRVVAGGVVYVQPESWASCYKCRYGTAAPRVTCANDQFGRPIVMTHFVNGVETAILPGDNLFRCETLEVIPETNEIKLKPIPGTQFSEIGCIGVNTATGSFTNPNASADVVQILLNIVTSLSGVFAMVFIIISSVSLLTSRGDPEKIREGKKKLTNTIVGIVFTFFALFIFRFIALTMLRIPGVD